MSRLIDADKIKTDLTTVSLLNNLFRSTIDNQPTVDAEPVKHGHWIHKFGYNGERHTVCSSCGHDRCGHFSFSFCMDCGAKMDEKSDSDSCKG